MYVSMYNVYVYVNVQVHVCVYVYVYVYEYTSGLHIKPTPSGNETSMRRLVWCHIS